MIDDLITMYNVEFKNTNVDKIQYGFRIEIQEPANIRKKKLIKEIHAGINMFYTALRRVRVRSCSPVPAGEMDCPDWAEKEAVSVLGFPFRFAFVRWEDDGVERFKMGILIEREQ